MYLTILSNIFGILPINKQFKLSYPLLFHSSVLLMGTAYLLVKRVEFTVGLLATGYFSDKRILECASMFLRFSTWLIHLRAVIKGDTHDIDFPRNKRSIIETTITLVICLGFPLFETIMTCMCIPKTLPGGLTRAIHYLIVIQFVGTVEQLATFNDQRVSSDINGSIKVQKYLLEKARKLNDVYKIQLLCCTGTIFVTLSTEAYFILSRFFSDRHSIFYSGKKFDRILYLGLFAQELILFSLAFYWLLRMVGCCENFYQKMEILNDRIYNSIKKDGYLKANVKLQLHAIKRPTVIFTAYRFFPIGYPLITSVVAAAAMYLVILLQFPGY